MTLPKTVSKLLDRLGKVPTPKLEAIRSPDGDGVLYAVRDGWNVERQRGPRRGCRAHIFHDPQSFAAWLNRHAGDPPPPESVELAGPDDPMPAAIVAASRAYHCEILAGEDVVTAALNPRDPHGDVVVYEYRFDPVFTALREKLDERLSQRELMLFLRGIGTRIVDADVLLSSLSTLIVKSGASLESHVDETGYTRVRVVGESNDVEARIAPRFVVVTPIIEGVLKGVGGPPAAYSLEVFVETEVRPGELLFTLRLPTLEADLRCARRDAVAYLAELLTAGPFLIGSGDVRLLEAPMPVWPGHGCPWAEAQERAERGDD
ncbi:MAG: hypothetical protein ACYTAN_01785 [Planctomycetota bacterium]|jgi:hypothetical protein